MISSISSDPRNSTGSMLGLSQQNLALQNLAPQNFPLPGSTASDQSSFAQILSIADRGPLARKSDAREVAETFVAVALVEPALKQARESTWAAPPFAPSQAEKQFGALIDSHVAREVTRAANFPLVDRLARNMRSM